MYKVIEVSLANIQRAYQYKLQDVYKAGFGIKGFDYPWVVTSRQWKKDERVLDVGAAYSPLPAYLHEKFGCELWAVDDFGMASGEQFWERQGSPHEFIAEHPEIHYVVERIGDPQQSSLPKGYFDVIYSISTLEHIPGHLQAAAWRHMDSLLKPGGVMLHAVDIDFPSNSGLKGMLKAAAFNLLYPVLPSSIRYKYCCVTPQAYLGLCFPAIDVRSKTAKGLSIMNMALNPDILAQAYEHGWYRIQKDGLTDYRYRRIGSLMIHIQKSG